MLGFTLRAFLSLKRSRDSQREKLIEQILAIPEVQACHVADDHDGTAKVGFKTGYGCIR